MHAFRLFAFVTAFFTVPAALAQEEPIPSNCLAMAQTLPDAIFVGYQPVAAGSGEVTISYAGHSTYVIETPEGVRIATDFSGYYGAEPPPRVVTMNKAHSTHFTETPDP